MRRGATALVLLSSSAMATACQVLFDIDVLPTRTPEGVRCDEGVPPVTSGGPEMVQVRRPDETCFWVDETEVTISQFDAFVDAGPFPDRDAVCSWNVVLQDRSEGCAGWESDDDLSDGELPATCVNYCDARAFCEWAGKSLCAGDTRAPDDIGANDWTFACSGASGNPYPYGRSYDAERCNGSDHPTSGCGEDGACTLVAASALSGCRSAEGVLSLSGNVAEWVDACTGSAGRSDQCEQRGGSNRSNANQLQCSVVDPARRDTRSASVGFRCCVR